MRIKPNKNHTAAPKRPVKTAGYCHDTLDAKQNRRREQAELRQAQYAALSLDQKIKRANERRGQSRREWFRLTGETL